jgi:hypothetical protein
MVANCSGGVRLSEAAKALTLQEIGQCFCHFIFGLNEMSRESVVAPRKLSKMQQNVALFTQR